MANQRIRIRLKAFDHRLIDQSAQEIVEQHRDELGVDVVPFKELVYLPERQHYEEVSKLPPDTPTARLSGTQVREDFLSQGKPLPEWFTRQEVAEMQSEVAAGMNVTDSLLLRAGIGSYLIGQRWMQLCELIHSDSFSTSSSLKRVCRWRLSYSTKSRSQIRIRPTPARTIVSANTLPKAPQPIKVTFDASSLR